ncbi:unnamed protein product [Leuciscus chuanchicus]
MEAEKESNSVTATEQVNTSVDNNSIAEMPTDSVQSDETVLESNNGEGSAVLVATDRASVVSTHEDDNAQVDEDDEAQVNEDLIAVVSVSDAKYPEKQSELEYSSVQGSSLQGDMDLSQRTDDLSEDDSESECPDTGEEHDLSGGTRKNCPFKGKVHPPK